MNDRTRASARRRRASTLDDDSLRAAHQSIAAGTQTLGDIADLVKVTDSRSPSRATDQTGEVPVATPVTKGLGSVLSNLQQVLGISPTFLTVAAAGSMALGVMIGVWSYGTLSIRSSSADSRGSPGQTQYLGAICRACIFHAVTAAHRGAHP